MEFGVQTSKGRLSATLRAPRALVWSVVVHIVGFLAFAGYTWVQLQIVKHDLDQCKAQIAQHDHTRGGD